MGKLTNFIERKEQSEEVKLITLILLRKFISVDYFTVLINSRKVSRSAREKELRHGKKFWRDFLNLY